MSQFLETIKYADGQFFRQEYHDKRFNGVRKYQFKAPKIDLFDAIQVPEDLGVDPYKVRVIYSEEIEKVEFIPYEVKPIKSLKVVHNDTIEYAFKSVDRTQIDLLFEQKEKQDDILIVRNRKLTDTSYCNIALFDGTEWYTPKAPLLKGTQRAFLIDFGLVSEEDLRLKDLGYFKKIRLFNSMIEWTDCLDIKIQNIL